MVEGADREGSTVRRTVTGTLLAIVALGAPMAAPASAADQVRVVAVGDIACDPSDPRFNNGRGTGLYCRQAETAQTAQGQSPDLVLALGDNQYEAGRRSSYRASFDPSWARPFLDRRDRSANQLWPVPGNHEYYTTGAAGYWSFFNGGTQSSPRTSGIAGTTYRGWYQRRTGGWQILALNSNCDQLGSAGCGSGSKQYRWLKKKLQSSSARCTLAYWHHPRFTDGEHTDAVEMRPFWKLLDRYDAELVLSGHNHSYERFAPMGAGARAKDDGVRQFVVGTGGKSLYAVAPNGGPTPEVFSDTTMGVLSLDLGRNSYSWRFVPASFPGNGTFTDSGSADCLG